MLYTKLLSTLSSWEDNIVEKRILGFFLWRMQSVWHGYSKMVACERKHEGWKFIMIQEIIICEMTWYKIIGLSKSTYMLYKIDSKRGCNVCLYLTITKVHINYKFEPSRQNKMFNPWLTWVLTQCCINWKESKMVDWMFNDCYWYVEEPLKAKSWSKW